VPETIGLVLCTRLFENLETRAMPLSDAIIGVLSRLVDDAQAPREPAHSDLDFYINKSGLSAGDPRQHGQSVGKAKRLRATLSWALENNPAGGEELVDSTVTLLRSYGGFREDSPNFVGEQPIKDAISAFLSEGYELSLNGELRPCVLENLSTVDMTAALEAYARRAKRGVADAALLTGIAKDLLEAVAAHVLVCRYGSYPVQSNFPTLLGQAFVALEMATSEHPPIPNEPTQKGFQRAVYELACKINRLRAKEGTGHGRPWLPTVTDAEARAAVEFMGSIAEFMLSALSKP
jgi:hypothetical protein